MTEQRVLGGVGTEVVFENDRVRIWQLRLAPGEKSAIHEHELDHILIQVQGDKIAALPEPDTAGPEGEVPAVGASIADDVIDLEARRRAGGDRP